MALEASEDTEVAIAYTELETELIRLLNIVVSLQNKINLTWWSKKRRRC